MSKVFRLKRDPKPANSSDNLSLLGSSYDFCEVHRMTNAEENDKPYAVKVIDFRATRQHGIADADIISESKHLKDLSHQHLVMYHCSFSDFGQKISIVMDLIEGKDIGTYIRSRDRPGHNIQYKWLIQMVSALDHLITVGHMTHGDIQPKNIIIINADSGNAKLVGICLPSLQKAITPTNPHANTYISAERLAGEPYDERDDVWALGCVFAELLLGLHRENPIWGSSEIAVTLQTQLIGDCISECTLLGGLFRHMITPTMDTRCKIADLKTRIENCPAVHPPRNCSPSHPLMTLRDNPECIPTLREGTGEHAGTVVHTSHIGAGDVYIIENFLSPEMTATAKTSISQECDWFQLYDLSQGAPLPRMTSFQAAIDEEDGTLPVYRCDEPQPWDNQYTTSSWTPTINAIRQEVELAAGHAFNWCRVQHYHGGNASMSYHSDKYLDIKEGSFVASISLGDERCYLLKPKECKDYSSAMGSSSPAQKLRLKHNTLLMLGPNTNMHFLHAIDQVPSDRPDKKKHRGRISITFRLIATFYCPLYKSSLDRLCFYGQGAAKVQTKAELVQANREVRRKRSAITGAVSFLTGGLVAGLHGLLQFMWPEVGPSNYAAGLLTCSSALIAGMIAQLIHLNVSLARRARRTRRFAIVFSLLDVLPLNPQEAKRLVYEASEEEISRLVQESRPIADSAIKKTYGYKTKGKLQFTLPAADMDGTEMDIPLCGNGSDTNIARGAMKLKRSDVLQVKGVLAVSRRPSLPTRSQSSPVSVNKPVVSVCIIVDAVKDFLYASGAFAKAYGQQDTMKIRHLKLVLSKVYHYCHDNGIQVILVTSAYSDRQFKTVPGLCTSDCGREFAFECAECQGGCHRKFDDDIILTKTTNSILDCGVDSRELLLQTIRGKAVLLCGVTTVACIRSAVEDLKDHCMTLLVAKDSVASRASLAEKEARLFRQWGADDDRDGGSYRDGYDGGNDGYESLRVVDSWERSLLRRA